MATNESRVFAEGSLRWVQASGTGATWSTASGAATGLVGYVQAGMNFTRTRGVTPIMERGVADHFKATEPRPARDVTFTFLQGVSANYPPTATTGAGASLPLVHFEIKHNRPEIGAASAEYHQIVYATFESDGWTEEAIGNKYNQKWKCIDILGPVSTGYLATGGQ